MKRGPKPTDKQILKIRGSWRADLPESKKTIKAKRPICPKWLSDGAKKIWRKYAKDLYKAGKLCTENEVAFAHFCDSQAEFINANEKIKELRKAKADDKTILGWLKYKERCRASVMKRANSFGLVPDENKIMVVTKEKPKKEESQARQWIDQQKGTG